MSAQLDNYSGGFGSYVHVDLRPLKMIMMDVSLWEMKTLRQGSLHRIFRSPAQIFKQRQDAFIGFTDGMLQDQLDNVWNVRA
jgi:hypothetical protein